VCERGGERGDEWWNAHANANANAQNAAAIGGLRGVGGGGGGACACESAKRHANAGCESADMPSGMQMQAGVQNAKGGMMGSGGRGHARSSRLSCGNRNSGVPPVLNENFLSERKNLNIFSFGFVVSEFAKLHFDFRTKIRIPRGM
jgi:hypothetical protein